jgi:hypothetical protein
LPNKAKKQAKACFFKTKNNHTKLRIKNYKLKMLEIFLMPNAK